MGHNHSKVEEEADGTHFTRKEMKSLKQEFEKLAQKDHTITKQQFKKILDNHVQFWAAGNMFLERLFDAFDKDGSKSIDLEEFLSGLSVFMKGTPQEKLELTFKFYDLNNDGTVTQREVSRVLNQLYSAFYQRDQTQEIEQMTRRWFEDLDVNGDGELSFEEFQLSALKEPMVVNFLEQFLIEKTSQT